MDVDSIECNAKEAASLFKALSNEKRLLIVCALYKGEKSVGKLEEIVDLSQSALSQHLAKLRADNLVSTRRAAQTIYYSLNSEVIDKVMGRLCSVCSSKDK
ncbi:MAG: transcriptional regulator [Alphaproteobacteria bacterium]|nr:MAG: transcriptional regulator [Alphaproteobacteria bacterium]